MAKCKDCIHFHVCERWCLSFNAKQCEDFVDRQTSEQAYKNGYSAGYEAGRRSVGRKRGRWIKLTQLYKCSECARVVGGRNNFCPDCGAMMDGDGNA